MAGVRLEVVTDFYNLFTNPWAMILTSPGVILGVFLSVIVPRCKSTLVLPGVLIITTLIFYLVLMATGSTLDDAREYGWLDRYIVRHDALCTILTILTIRLA
jgi:hypothetical protein